jgi:YegS/Rv2252/BmrU family lipid kinase
MSVIHPLAPNMAYAFILNPLAGGKKDPSFFAKVIDQFCREKKLEYVLWKTERPGHGRVLAEDALKRGFQCVVAIGGDGTINEIARPLLSTRVPLGIIPKGSANGFAREFGIPLNPRKACETLLQSKELSIDVGKINEEYFFSVAGLGFDAQVGYAYNQGQKGRHRGRLPYFTAGIREYFSYVPCAMNLSFGGSERRLTPFLVALANSKQYGIGARIAPKAVVNDGLLTLAIVHQASWYQHLWHLPKVFTGNMDRAPFVETVLTKEVKIAPEKEVPYHIDGEIRIGGGRLVATIEPGALTLKVPQTYIARSILSSQMGRQNSSLNK